MKKPVLRYRTIVLSDVHLGTLDCKAEEVNFFLKHSRSEKLILNGDIVDGWSLRRKGGGGWDKPHTRFLRQILKKAEKKDTEIVYLRGNHDDFLAHVLPIAIERFNIVEDHVHTSASGKHYLVVHGDVFDTVTMNSRWLAILGDIGYQSLLKINRFYNHYRAWRGKGYYSISKAIKARVKSAVNHISRFEDHLQELARRRDCQGIICGHIHTPEDKMVADVHYLNSGDWVESLTALVEHFDGRWEVLPYGEFCRRLEHRLEDKKARKAEKKAAKAEALAATGQAGAGADATSDDDEDQPSEPAGRAGTHSGAAPGEELLFLADDDGDEPAPGERNSGQAAR